MKEMYIARIHETTGVVVVDKFFVKEDELIAKFKDEHGRDLVLPSLQSSYVPIDVFKFSSAAPSPDEALKKSIAVAKANAEALRKAAASHDSDAEKFEHVLESIDA